MKGGGGGGGGGGGDGCSGKRIINRFTTHGTLNY